MFRALAAFGACAAIAFAQPYGTQPKPKVEDYPVHVRAGDVAIGAEYLVHTLATGHRSYDIPDHLVVEVAVYPPKGETMQIGSGSFTLRMNGKKDRLYSQAPGMVAASLKYPDWETRPRLEAGVGPVIIGRPQPTERFPGDRRPTEDRVPNPVPPTTTPAPGGVEREQPQTAAEAVNDTAFPDGSFSDPVSGFIFFYHRGKTRSIRSMELIFQQGEKQTVLRLF